MFQEEKPKNFFFYISSEKNFLFVSKKIVNGEKENEKEERKRERQNRGRVGRSQASTRFTSDGERTLRLRSRKRHFHSRFRKGVIFSIQGTLSSTRRGQTERDSLCRCAVSSGVGEWEVEKKVVLDHFDVRVDATTLSSRTIAWNRVSSWNVDLSDRWFGGNLKKK